MATILQTHIFKCIFLNESEIVFWLLYQWIVFLRAQLTIIIGSSNGLVLNSQQALTRTSDGLVY